jgi:hypothetical protein
MFTEFCMRKMIEEGLSGSQVKLCYLVDLCGCLLMDGNCVKKMVEGLSGSQVKSFAAW